MERRKPSRWRLSMNGGDQHGRPAGRRWAASGAAAPTLRLAAGLLAAATAILPAGCRSLRPDAPLNALDPANLTTALEPSNSRNWKPHMAVLPRAEIQDDRLAVYNIRNFKYVTEDEYILDYYDKTFDLSELESVDFVVVPFKTAPSLAHTMLSFGFRDGQYLAVSAEVRLEEGESYSPWKGALNQYEIMYVVADERDLIKLRTQYRKSDVYIYHTKATPEQARFLLTDVMQRVNKLVEQPEFYNTFTNNCTTSIVRHINHLAPGKVPLDIRVLLPGYSDKLAYDLGLIDTDLSFTEARRAARVNDLAELYQNRREFSKLIRR